jgi:pimeloyl-ACP methyl ester carboxylesterase
MLDCVRRTDPKARKIMFTGFDKGEVLDQRKVVGETDIPIAVVNGQDEPFINIEFIRGVKFGNLWGGKCIEMPGLQHAPFWGKPKEFQDILDKFVEDCSK